MNGYELSRKWFDFSFEEPKCKVQHTALFFWIVELNNRFGWKKQFGLPTREAMEALSIGNKNTYLAALKDLEKWGFIKIISPSKNQNQSCIISVCRVKSEPALDTALDTALIQHGDGTDNGNGYGTDPIDKQRNNETTKQRNNETILWQFNEFWKLYDKNIGMIPCQRLWAEIDAPEYPKILAHVAKYVKATPDKKFRKNPEKYLADRSWMDEIEDYGGEKPKEEKVYPEGYDKDHDPKDGFWEKRWDGTIGWTKYANL